MKWEGLTKKQKLFCLEYLKDFNGSRAYKEAYWTKNDDVARVNASKLLAKTNIREFVQRKADEITKEKECSVEWILEQLKDVVKIGKWEKEVELQKGKWKKVLDLSAVNTALTNLGKYQKMFTDKVENDTSITIKIVSFNDIKEKWQK